MIARAFPAPWTVVWGLRGQHRQDRRARERRIEIIITERTYNPVDPEIFRHHGIEPSRKKILLV